MKIDFLDEKVILGWKHNKDSKQTACYLRWADGKAVEAMATCSAQDRFNKAVGRKVSLTRLLNKLSNKKEVRRQVWQQVLPIVKMEG